MPPWRSIVLTGASSGLGRALAVELAGPGTAMLLIARDPERLAATAAEAAGKGAIVETAAIDIRDAEGLARVLLSYDDRHPVDLVIANAGIARGLGPGRSLEPPELSVEILATNLGGTHNTIQPLLPRLSARGQGQIALIASLAAIRPSGDLPAYSASKAAIVAWGVALRRRLRKKGLAVSIVTPGFFRSPMSDRHHGPRPFRIDADRAASRIATGLRRRRARISVPWLPSLLVRLENLLPPAIADRIERRFAADIGDPDEGLHGSEAEERRFAGQNRSHRSNV